MGFRRLRSKTSPWHLNVPVSRIRRSVFRRVKASSVGPSQYAGGDRSQDPVVPKKNKRGPAKGSKYGRRVETQIRFWSQRCSTKCIHPAKFRRDALGILKNVRNELGTEEGVASKLSPEALDQLQSAAEAGCKGSGSFAFVSCRNLELQVYHCHYKSLAHMQKKTFPSEEKFMRAHFVLPQMRAHIQCIMRKKA